MPVVTGTAVAQAATQLRIIELDQVLDGNISNSMNFAIDFSNQTFRMTGLQFLDYLNLSLAIDGVNVAYDNVIFQSFFPLEPTPPTNVQNAIDFGMPILANADAGNIGKGSAPTFAGDLDTLTIAGFTGIGDSATNKPTAFGGSLITFLSSGVSTAQIYVSVSDDNYWMRTQFNSAWSDWKHLSTTIDLDDYLPLTGGALTGDGAVLDVHELQDGGTVIQRFLAFDDVTIGRLGKSSAGNDFSLQADLASLSLGATNGNVSITAGSNGNITATAAINLTAPTITENGTPFKAVSSDTVFGGFKHTVVGTTLNLFTV